MDNSSESFCCLSPVVKKLILVHKDYKELITSDSRHYFDKNGHLNWKNLKRNDLSSLVDFPPSSPIWEGVLEREWFTASLSVQKVSIEAQKMMNKATIEEIWQKFPNSFKMPFSTIISRIYEEYRRSQNALFGITALCPLIERTLGDLFSTLEEKAQANVKLRRKPPPLVRDLLQTEELLNFLGDDFIFLLQVMIGNPRSLNLRNIVWHGFAVSSEIQGGYFLLLLILFLDICEHKLCGVAESSTVTNDEKEVSQAQPPLTLQLRELKDLRLIQPEAYDFGMGPMAMLFNYVLAEDGSFSDDEKEVQSIFRILEESTFVLPGRREMIVAALEQYANGERDPMGFYFCLIHMLPALEHCLRAVWIKSNRLPSPLLCADSYRYYTIIDMFLDSHLHEDIVNLEALTTVSETSFPASPVTSTQPKRSPSALNPGPANSTCTNPGVTAVPTQKEIGSTSPSIEAHGSKKDSKSDQSAPSTVLQPNALIDEIGIPIMTALNDTLLYPYGPRPRDRISHGDVEPTTVTKYAAARCLEIFITIALHYLPPTSDFSDDKNLPASLVTCKNYYQNYVACWHPHGLLERQLHETVYSVWRRWKSNVLRLTSTNENNEHEDDVIRRRSGYSEEMNIVTALITKISENRALVTANSSELVNSIVIDSATLTCTLPNTIDLDQPKLKLTKFDSLNCDGSATTTFDGLRKVLLEVHSLLEIWNARFEAQKEQVESKQATTRLETTFYKQLAVLDLATLFFSSILGFIELRIHKASINVKMIRKIATTIAQIKQKVSQNSWDELVPVITSTVTILWDMVE